MALLRLHSMYFIMYVVEHTRRMYFVLCIMDWRKSSSINIFPSPSPKALKALSLVCCFLSCLYTHSFWHTCCCWGCKLRHMYVRRLPFPSPTIESNSMYVRRLPFTSLPLSNSMYVWRLLNVFLASTAPADLDSNSIILKKASFSS